MGTGLTLVRALWVNTGFRSSSDLILEDISVNQELLCRVDLAMIARN